MRMWNFDTIFIQVLSFHQNLGSISLIFWKLCAFRQHNGSFQQFFHHNFRLKWKFWILMFSLEKSCSDLSEYTLFQIKNIFFIYKNQFLGENWIFNFFWAVFFKLLPKFFTDFINSDNCMGKITSKSIRLKPVLI